MQLINYLYRFVYKILLIHIIKLICKTFQVPYVYMYIVIVCKESCGSDQTLINIDENIVVQSNRPRYNVTIPPSEIHPHPLGPPSVVGRNGCFLCLFLINHNVGVIILSNSWLSKNDSFIVETWATNLCMWGMSPNSGRLKHGSGYGPQFSRVFLHFCVDNWLIFVSC